MNTKQQEVVEGDFDIQKMRTYISYCKTKCAPRLSPEAAEKLSSHFVEMREKVRLLDSGVGGNAKTAIPITVRYLILTTVNWKPSFVSLKLWQR
jgi:DNA replication licensing factor MCM5